MKRTSPSKSRNFKMTKNEMIKNVKALAIPALKVTFTMNVDELNEAVRNAMFERFVAEVVCDSELCGVSPLESRKFAINFIQSNDFVKMCLTATINLVLNGSFTQKWQLNGFIDKLIWSHVIKACHEKLGNNKNIPIDMI